MTNAEDAAIDVLMGLDDETYKALGEALERQQQSVQMVYDRVRRWLTRT